MPPLTDPASIRAVLETDRPWAVYPLGDLSAAHFPHCHWWYHANDQTPALVLLYRAFVTPVLCTLGPPALIKELLTEIGELPEMYLHVRPEIVPILAHHYEIREKMLMWRMILQREVFRPPPLASDEVAPLGPADLEALERLYADGEEASEQPGFFSPAMLTEGIYRGVWEGEALIAAAGTHLVVPEEGVAAIGNVYTRRDRRGRGLATRLTGVVAAELVRCQVRTIALNVNQNNEAAIAVYERLGFARYCPFVEGLAVRYDARNR
jgi:GNAT superfamily N-acetyltransferase